MHYAHWKLLLISLPLLHCSYFSELGQVYTWGFGPIGKGPDVTYSKSPTLIPPTLFGQNVLTPEAKVISTF